MPVNTASATVLFQIRSYKPTRLTAGFVAGQVRKSVMVSIHSIRGHQTTARPQETTVSVIVHASVGLVTARLGAHVPQSKVLWFALARGSVAKNNDERHTRGDALLQPQLPVYLGGRRLLAPRQEQK